MSAKEYREYADECIRSARNSTSVKECRDFLQTAEAWLHAADLLQAEPGRKVVAEPDRVLTFPAWPHQTKFASSVG